MSKLRTARGRGNQGDWLPAPRKYPGLSFDKRREIALHNDAIDAKKRAKRARRK